MESKIVYTDLDSPIGPMIAGATEKGVCFLEWHDRGGVDRIKKRVANRYNRKLEPGENQHLKKLISELKAYFAGSLKQFKVAIDVTGTPFEQKAWTKLLEIDYGQTWSYGQMAKSMDNPGGARAVGRANGANYLGIVIPCHRVIAADGKLVGYGGKVWRKKFLLELEAGGTQQELGG